MRSRGISTEMSRRLWTRAPWTEILVRGPLRAGGRLAGIGWLRRKERKLLHRDVAALGEQHRRRRLVDQPGVRQVFTRRRHAVQAVGLREVILDVAARTDVAVF